MNYVVRSGDTLATIAAKFNTTVDELLRANLQITDPNLIYPGQVIHIPGPTPVPTNCPILRRGSTGPAVIYLQNHLKMMGFYQGAIDGDFGPKTEAAVFAFQKSKNILQDGIVCRQTWTAIGVQCTQPSTNVCPTLNQGDRGPSVKRLQELLLAAGFNPGAIDGIFGPKTEGAVLAFQKSRNLVPDGIVGVKTWTALGVNCRP